MSGAPAPAPTASGGRRCRPRGIPLAPGQLRPTDVIGAFFLVAVLMGLAGAGVAIANAVDPWPWGRWLALHLVFLGAISQLVLGASQFFAGAFLATDPPPRKLIRGQLLCWNAGTLAVAAGVTEYLDAVTAAGVALLLAALVLYAAGFGAMSRRALNSAPWAARWYLAAAAFLAPGIVAGLAMANGYAWSPGDLLAAHMALNLAGWFGAAIVGTLHTFYPSLTRTQLRHPRLQAPTFAAWTAGVAALALGYGFDLDALSGGGWVLLAVAAALLGANVIGSLRAAQTGLSLPARLVGVAQLFLVAGIAVAAAAAIDLGPAHALTGSTRATVATLLVAGWIGLTVVGSLLHLLALLNRVRDLRRAMPEPHPVRDMAITAIAAAAVAALALGKLIEADAVADAAAALTIAVFAGLGARVLLLAGRAAVRARPRI